MTGRAKRIVLPAVATVAAIVAVSAMAAGQAMAAGHAGGGEVYTLSNSTAGNAVLTFERRPDGSLTAGGSTPSGGAGTGAGLGSQGAVILSKDGEDALRRERGQRQRPVVRRHEDGPSVSSHRPSGGDLPTSLTHCRGILYVLNTGSPNSICGPLGPRRNGERRRSRLDRPLRPRRRIGPGGA